MSVDPTVEDGFIVEGVRTGWRNMSAFWGLNRNILGRIEIISGVRVQQSHRAGLMAPLPREGAHLRLLVDSRMRGNDGRGVRYAPAAGKRYRPDRLGIGASAPQPRKLTS
jgi:hypothetical protein